MKCCLCSRGSDGAICPPCLYYLLTHLDELGDVLFFAKQSAKGQDVSLLHEAIEKLQRNVESIIEVKPDLSWKQAQDEFGKTFVQRAFEKNNWHRTNTAKQMSIERTYLNVLMNKFGIREK